MTDDQLAVDPEQDDAEDLALDAVDAEEVTGGGWPPLPPYTGGSRGGPI